MSIFQAYKIFIFITYKCDNYHKQATAYCSWKCFCTLHVKICTSKTQAQVSSTTHPFGCSFMAAIARLPYYPVLLPGCHIHLAESSFAFFNQTAQLHSLFNPVSPALTTGLLSLLYVKHKLLITSNFVNIYCKDFWIAQWCTQYNVAQAEHLHLKLPIPERGVTMGDCSTQVI